MYVLLSAGAMKPEALDLLGAIVTGSCKSPMWVLGTELGSSARARNAHNHLTISLVPY